MITIATISDTSKLTYTRSGRAVTKVRLNDAVTVTAYGLNAINLASLSKGTTIRAYVSAKVIKLFEVMQVC